MTCGPLIGSVRSPEMLKSQVLSMSKPDSAEALGRKLSRRMLRTVSAYDLINEGDRIMVAIIPHTAQVTTIGLLVAGAPLNVEVDVLAKYVERLLAHQLAVAFTAGAPEGGIPMPAVFTVVG